MDFKQSVVLSISVKTKVLSEGKKEKR